MQENTPANRDVASRQVYLAGAVRLNAAARFALFRFLFWSLLFGLAYTQPALYYSNQNQYFLHGLANGGLGFLKDDWLANTADPTPLFSALVAFTHLYLHDSFFYIYYILVIGIYFHALLGIFEHLSGGRATALMRLSFIAFLVTLNSAILRWTSAQLFGVDYPWYFQAGVANQYVLGAGLQPSVFGVFLVLSVADFLHDRPLFAVIWSSLAAVMHSTYLLSAAFLTLAYLYLLVRDRRIRMAMQVGACSLLLVSPVVAYNLRMFAPSSPEAFAQAQHLIAHFRIPHHSRVDRWLDGIAWAQIGWIVAAMLFVRGSRLLVILAASFVLGLVLTLVQIGTGNDTLALLFPWRVSSILVPISTVIVLARIVQRLAAWFTPVSRWYEGALQTACLALLTLSVLGGMLITYFGLGYRTSQQELPLLEHIRANKAEGDVYLLPVEVPKLTAPKRGAASLNFTPPPRRTSQIQNISVDLQQFRLFTGAPIYIDFKSIPYKDSEMLEWHQRLVWNHQLYEQRDWNNKEITDQLRERRITHVVTTADRDIRCAALQLIYADKYYRLYRVQWQR